VVVKAWHPDVLKTCLAQVPYIWKRRADGLYIINLAKTWEKLMLAARIIVAIENPADGVTLLQSLHWRHMERCKEPGLEGQAMHRSLLRSPGTAMTLRVADPDGFR